MSYYIIDFTNIPELTNNDNGLLTRGFSRKFLLKRYENTISENLNYPLSFKVVKILSADDPDSIEDIIGSTLTTTENFNYLSSEYMEIHKNLFDTEHPERYIPQAIPVILQKPITKA